MLHRLFASAVVLGSILASTPARADTDSKGDAPAQPAAETKAETNLGARVPGITLIVLGAAPLLAGTIFGVISLQAAHTASSQCTNDICPASAASDLARAHTFGDASTIAFVTGGLLAVTGITLAIVAPSGDSSKTGARRPASLVAGVVPWVGPGAQGVSVRASF